MTSIASATGTHTVTPKICPSCASSEVRKATAVHEQQTHQTNSHTTGVGIGTGGIGVGAASTTGQSQSLAALKLSPPADPLIAQIMTILIGGVALLVVGAGFQSGPGSVVVLGLAAWLWFTAQARKPAYRKAKAAYERKWYCFQCGHVGDVDEYSGVRAN